MEACCSSSILTVRPIDVLRLAPHRRASLRPTQPAASSYRASRASLSSFRPGFLHPNSNPLFARRANPTSSSRRRWKQTISAVFERFTERAIKAVVFSQREAKALGKDMVFPQHLLLGLIAEDRSLDGFLGSGITVGPARDAVRAIWNDGAAADEDGAESLASNMPFSISSKRVFEAAVEFSRSTGCNFIAPEHIAVGLFTSDDGSSGLVLKRLGADANNLTSAALLRLQGELAKDGRETSKVSSKMRQKLPSGKAARAKPPEKSKDKSILAQFCVDLTAWASEGHIDPVIGRDIEIQRVVQILCRRTKNNPILLGDPGVGKTAIAEGLALRISCGGIPIFLSGKRIMSLDIGLLMAGAKERGELEARVTGLIAEVQKAGDVILFIDEVHTLVGSGTVGRGNKGSGLDISNLLKPALGRGELQVFSLDQFVVVKIWIEATSGRLEIHALDPEKFPHNPPSLALAAAPSLDCLGRRPAAPIRRPAATGQPNPPLIYAMFLQYIIVLIVQESAMLRLDMSEYMERFTVSKLIGSPPGYVGYGEGGTLTEAVRRRPFTVILLDEIEKAHPDIFNILLQIFEDGHLTDSQGRRVSFKNTLIVMTSNVGSTSISKGRRSIGFMLADDSASNSYSAMKSLVMEELKAYFRPELLNRIDEVVVFRPLEKEQMMEILNIMLIEVKRRLLSLGMGLEVSDSVKDLVCQQGYDKSYGARPLRRAVTQIIEDVISEAILAGDYKPGDTVVIDVGASGNPFVTCLADQTIKLSSDTTSML
ncbi:chaperone protein ClpD, chloroplastic [Dendrobium catenatum]|uniref:chaperone protein ClpD, chloroplastic n=1 Tax=Dendrobium catenatum TaxID=906689 RepID=UPI0010A02827|nr:chaperone protein ClpD, chloroplastic [Dendrobium catenatum]